MRTFVIMTALLLCLIILYCVMPLIELFFNLGLDSHIKPFPYKMVFPYDPYCSLMVYVITYMFTSYAGICVVTTLFAEDSVFGFFITYTCCQFQLLHEKIRCLFMEEIELNANDQNEWQIYYKRLESIVEKHNKIIRWVFFVIDNIQKIDISSL